MTWNHDLTTAPRDGTHVILAMPNKTTLRSYWCTPKGEPEHWCMLSHKNQPVAWMLWPEHPFAAASQGEAAAPAPTNVSLPEVDIGWSGDGANAGGGHVTDDENAQTDNAGEHVNSSPAHLIIHKHIFLDDVGGGA